ncbi:putative ubiquinol-cytochrome-c reductase complex assembly factor 3-like [Apostichopus japonicus]|uniref:Putative ubiquinol-cytochrome-c reductase complex assembly factor 3-like n=1 Tax=Stichopus japonicus TaxID=307972 RepID=A0A2G8L2A2_STIJA|nr:putative ubiquinol-cytochrome-c reductase complex assembly factor 3-like [Apostichopus japonicus]
MSSRSLVAVALISLSGFGGWLLMRGISPSTEDLKKKLPEGNPVNYSQSQRDAQKLMDALRAAADNPEPIYKTWKKD